MKPHVQTIVFALYPRSRAVKFVSGFLYFAEVVTLSIGTGLAIPRMVFYGEYCSVRQAPEILLIVTCVL